MILPITELHRINAFSSLLLLLLLLVITSCVSYCMVCRACMVLARRCTSACPVCWTAAEWAASSTWPWPMTKSLSWSRAPTLCGVSRKTWRTCRSTAGHHALLSLTLFTRPQYLYTLANSVSVLPSHLLLDTVALKAFCILFRWLM